MTLTWSKARDVALTCGAIGVMVASLSWSWLQLRESFQSRDLARVASPILLDKAQATKVSQGGQLMGNTDAPIEMVEFSDFQCPYCHSLARALQQIEQEYPGRVRVRFRHLPITSVHPDAQQAAIASECAAKQHRFQPMHDVLFARQEEIRGSELGAFAIQAGITDTLAFSHCLRDDEMAARVEADIALAMKLRIRGTPAFVINSTLYQGTVSSDSLARLLSLR